MWDPWHVAGFFAQTARRPVNLDFLWVAFGLVALILIGAICIAWIDRWRKQTAAEEPDSVEAYRALHEKGLLSSEEYERIRGRLEKQNLSLSSPSAAQAANVVEPDSSNQQALPGGPQDPAPI